MNRVGESLEDYRKRNALYQRARRANEKKFDSVDEKLIQLRDTWMIGYDGPDPNPPTTALELAKVAHIYGDRYVWKDND